MDGIRSSGGRNSGGVPQRNASGASKTCRFCCVFFVFCLACPLDVLVVFFVPVAIVVPGSAAGLWNRRGTHVGRHVCHRDTIIVAWREKNETKPLE